MLSQCLSAVDRVNKFGLRITVKELKIATGVVKAKLKRQIARAANADRAAAAKMKMELMAQEKIMTEAARKRYDIMMAERTLRDGIMRAWVSKQLLNARRLLVDKRRENMDRRGSRAADGGARRLSSAERHRPAGKKPSGAPNGGAKLADGESGPAGGAARAVGPSHLQRQMVAAAMQHRVKAAVAGPRGGGPTVAPSKQLQPQPPGAAAMPHTAAKRAGGAAALTPPPPASPKQVAVGSKQPSFPRGNVGPQQQQSGAASRGDGSGSAPTASPRGGPSLKKEEPNAKSRAPTLGSDAFEKESVAAASDIPTGKQRTRGTALGPSEARAEKRTVSPAQAHSLAAAEEEPKGRVSPAAAVPGKKGYVKSSAQPSSRHAPEDAPGEKDVATKNNASPATDARRSGGGGYEARAEKRTVSPAQALSLAAAEEEPKGRASPAAAVPGKKGYVKSSEDENHAATDNRSSKPVAAPATLLIKKTAPAQAEKVDTDTSPSAVHHRHADDNQQLRRKNSGGGRPPVEKPVAAEPSAAQPSISRVPSIHRHNSAGTRKASFSGEGEKGSDAGAQQRHVEAEEFMRRLRLEVDFSRGLMECIEGVFETERRVRRRLLKLVGDGAAHDDDSAALDCSASLSSSKRVSDAPEHQHEPAPVSHTSGSVRSGGSFRRQQQQQQPVAPPLIDAYKTSPSDIFGLTTVEPAPSSPKVVSSGDQAQEPASGPFRSASSSSSGSSSREIPCLKETPQVTPMAPPPQPAAPTAATRRRSSVRVVAALPAPEKPLGEGDDEEEELHHITPRKPSLIGDRLVRKQSSTLLHLDGPTQLA
jgi:hypothetical protein